MVNRRKKISRKVKSQILLELAKPGYVISNISREYGVSNWTIYNWLKKQKASVAPAGGSSSGTSVNDSGEFVELAVAEGGGDYSLTKASLVFQDFSLSLEGKLSSSKLISILKILEVTC
jgi:transposase-like protein